MWAILLLNSLNYISNYSTRLVGFESSVTKHPDLVSYMLPVVGRAFLCQVISELCSHRDNTISHHFNVRQPIGLKWRLYSIYYLCNDIKAVFIYGSQNVNRNLINNLAYRFIYL